MLPVIGKIPFKHSKFQKCLYLAKRRALFAFLLAASDESSIKDNSLIPQSELHVLLLGLPSGQTAKATQF